MRELWLVIAKEDRLSVGLWTFFNLFWLTVLFFVTGGGLEFVVLSIIIGGNCFILIKIKFARREGSMLNKLCKEQHERAVDKGFYDESLRAQNLLKGISDMQGFSKTAESVRSSRVCQLLLLIISELTEAMEADRKKDFTFDEHEGGYKISDAAAIEDDADFKKLYEGLIKDTFNDEIAGALLRLFDLCGFLDIDIESHLKAAIRYNEMRPPGHGKKY